MLTLNDKWVVITRPEHQTENLQLKLAAAGAHSILFPLIEITLPNDLALMKKQLANLSAYDLVIFVSVNAVEQSFLWLSLLKNIKVATTGKKTAEALQRKEITIDFCPEKIFNSEALLAMPDFRVFCRNKKIAIIRGEGGRDLLRDELLQTAASVDYINVYQRQCPQNSLAVLEGKAQQGELDIILLTSGTSVENFFNLVKNEKWVNQLTLLLGSSRMQKKIPESFQGKLLVAEDPSDETLFKKLTAIFNKTK